MPDDWHARGLTVDQDLSNCIRCKPQRDHRTYYVQIQCPSPRGQAVDGARPDQPDQPGMSYGARGRKQQSRTLNLI